MSSENLGGHSTTAPAGSPAAARPSSPALPLSVSANEAHQIAQGGRREPRDAGLVETTLVVRGDDRQVGPPPWHGQHHAVVESDQHPRSVVAPEDPADAPPLTARRTLFRQDGEARTAQCNIRCSLSLG